MIFTRLKSVDATSFECSCDRHLKLISCGTNRKLPVYLFVFTLIDVQRLLNLPGKIGGLWKNRVGSEVSLNVFWLQMFGSIKCFKHSCVVMIHSFAPNACNFFKTVEFGQTNDQFDVQNRQKHLL